MIDEKSPLSSSGDGISYFGDTVLSKENNIRFRKYFEPIPSKYDALKHQKREIIKDILPEGTAMLYGASQTFKTFSCIDLAFHVAFGMKWAGKAVDSGIVLYFVGEGEPAFDVRLLAWAQRHDMTPPDLYAIGSKFIYAPLGKVAGLAFTTDRNEIFDAVKEVLEMHGSVPISLIVIDTKSKFAHGSENDPAEVVKFTNACNELAAKYHCCVLFTHHIPKGEQSTFRGSTVHFDNVDTVIKAERSGNALSVTCTVEKQRDGARFRWISNLGKVLLLDSDGACSLSISETNLSEISEGVDASEDAERTRITKPQKEKRDFAVRFAGTWEKPEFSLTDFREYLDYDLMTKSKNEDWKDTAWYESTPSSLIAKLISYGYITKTESGVYRFSDDVFNEGKSLQNSRTIAVC